MASLPFRQESFAADKPPPSWKRSTSYIKVSADSGMFGEEAPQPQSPGARVDKSVALQTPPLSAVESRPKDGNSTPVLPAEGTVQVANMPKTPRIAPPLQVAPPNSVTPDPSTGREVLPPTSPSDGHRRTISWGGSPTAGGKVHRRSRSIDSSQDVREAYRQQLERIGSMERAPSAGSGSLASTPRLLSTGSPTAPPGGDGLPPTAQKLTLPVPPPPKQPASNAVQDAAVSVWAGPPKPVKVKAVHNKEPELISWDEVEQQKDVYQAITTSDGRQALVKASSGKSGPEILFVSDLQTQETVQSNSSEMYSTAFAIPGTVPMMAVPVRYPDGRIMYHMYPIAQQVSPGPLSPAGSPHVVSPRMQGGSPGYPVSPTSAVSSVPTGHQRRPSVSTPSPLQTSSVPSYSSPTAYVSGFSAAAASPAAQPLSPAASGQLYSASSGPLSPRLSHGSSGHLFAAAVPGTTTISAMSPVGSGQLYNSPVYQAPQPQYSPAPAPAPGSSSSLACPSQQELHQQFAAISVGDTPSLKTEDPFGSSAVW